MSQYHRRSVKMQIRTSKATPSQPSTTKSKRGTKKKTRNSLFFFSGTLHRGCQIRCGADVGGNEWTHWLHSECVRLTEGEIKPSPCTVGVARSTISTQRSHDVHFEFWLNQTLSTAAVVLRCRYKWNGVKYYPFYKCGEQWNLHKFTALWCQIVFLSVKVSEITLLGIICIKKKC